MEACSKEKKALLKYYREYEKEVRKIFKKNPECPYCHSKKTKKKDYCAYIYDCMTCIETFYSHEKAAEIEQLNFKYTVFGERGKNDK